MAKVQYMGTGRRKKSVARVRLVPGEGRVIVNNREIETYFGLETLRVVVNQPLVLTETKDKYDVLVWWWIIRSSRSYKTWYIKSFIKS